MNLIVKVFFLAFLTTFMISCSKEEPQDETPAPQTPVSEDNIVGKWSFPDDGQLDYWTFYSNGTMLIEDEDDSFNGGTTTYSYNSANNQLTYFGGFLVQTIYWDSPNQWHTLTQGNFHGGTYTRVN